MMRADCLMSLPPQQQWPPATRSESLEKSRHSNNDSAIISSSSPIGNSSDANSSSSPQSPDRSDHLRYFPKRLEIDIPSQQQEDSLERLKIALERSSALSGIFKNNRDSAASDGLESPNNNNNNNNNDGESSQDGVKKEFPCPLCAYSTPYRHRYQEHLATHYADKCTLCDFTGKNISDLRNHLMEAHNMQDVQDLSDAMDNASDCQDDDDVAQGGKRGANGAKAKVFKCKQCTYVTTTKMDFWEHSKGHIKAEKLLTCTKCPFVTEYKHHLEYHLRNHYGSKPYKCTKCSYSCVNKSMLNSHLKSHSNVYQYRCADCAYATKYCHSLKLHLRKYVHNPAMVLNADGSPNPLPIIDVYGTRRGPKAKSAPNQKSSVTSSSPADDITNVGSGTDDAVNRHNLPGGVVVPNPISNNLSPHSIFDSPPNKFVYCNVCEFYTSSFEILNQHMFLHATESNFVQLFKTNNNEYPNIKVEPSTSPVVSQESSPQPVQNPPSPLDLTKTESPKSDLPQMPTPTSDSTKKSRRKGKAYKLERLLVKAEEEAECETKNETKKEVIEDETRAVEDSYNCSFCDISFKDVVMYTMHMGYHGYRDPFTCNMCGHVTKDRVAFFLHIARSSHS